MKAIITPFNVFSLLSFVLLGGVAILVHAGVSRWPLAAASALLGFLLIIMFLLWTLVTEEREA
ncbi:MAG TPA: hypothetical protein VHB98_08520 [Chloroflexota bacterium]|nr:hypothetical protein [Chloroflexota bacterium]